MPDDASAKAANPRSRSTAGAMAFWVGWALSAALSAAWFIIGLLVAPGVGDNVTCGCWADNPANQLGTVQWAIAMLGGICLTTGAGCVRTYRRVAIVAFALFVAAAVAWVLIYLPTTHTVGH